MSDVYKQELEKAVREYVEALDGYRKLVDRYVSVYWEGSKPRTPEPIKEAALRELQEAEAKVTESREKWHNLILLYNRGISDA